MNNIWCTVLDCDNLHGLSVLSICTYLYLDARTAPFRKQRRLPREQVFVA